MLKLFCLLNHELTSRQKSELHVLFDVESILIPLEEIFALWSAIPTDRTLTKNHLEPIIRWLRDTKTGDIIVLQGEFSASFALVDFALKKGLIPVCSVTKRIAQETKDGEQVQRHYIFEHICFRRYFYYDDLG